MSSTNDRKLIGIAGPGADEMNRMMADADAKAASVYDCTKWLCRSADDRDGILVESESFSDVLLAAAVGAQAQGVTIRIYGRGTQSMKEVHILTLEQPATVVGRWFRDILGAGERETAGMQRAVVMGALEAMLRWKLQDAALAGADDGPGH